MKIAVMGMGVAGSYLVSRLKNDHEVVGLKEWMKLNMTQFVRGDPSNLLW